ncbi:MAG: hypothetical protein [Bacteriophage sp.]|nr:MAG: hypothetical protein [Bacteriophage sp.]
MFKILIFGAGMFTMALLVKVDIAAKWVYPTDTVTKPEVKVITKVVTNPGVPEAIVVFNDDKRGVTCYYKKYNDTASGAALSCLPSNQLRASQ